MKKIITIFLFLMTLSLFAEGVPDASSKTRQAQSASKETAIAQIPIPQISYFVERKTISEWAKRWDKPAVVTYLYLFSFGNCIGYYVCNGKPASTQSYIMPEEEVHTFSSGYYTVSAPDIDGTYGTNNPGIRFFTAEGTAVEWAGSGASYLYSDQKLPLNVPKLNVTK